MRLVKRDWEEGLDIALAVDANNLEPNASNIKSSFISSLIPIAINPKISQELLRFTKR